MSFEEKGGKQQFEVACATRGFHVYRELWKSKLGQTLQVRQKIGNLHNAFVISLVAKIPAMLTDFDAVGTYYFLNYGGKLEACVRCTKYRPSQIPTGGISIIFIVKKETFEKLENHVKSRYAESKIVEKKSEIEEDIALEVHYRIESDITEDEFQPKEKFVTERKTPQEILETQSEKDGKSMKQNSILENETESQVIPETQESDDMPVFPETQVDVIFIDGYFNDDIK